MKRQILVLTIQTFVMLSYFVITTIIFYLAVSVGNEGVALHLFGGGDDGFFYWDQAQNIASGQDAVLTSIYPLIIGNLLKITGTKTVYAIRMFNYFGFILLMFFSMLLIKLQFSFEDKRLSSKYMYKPKVLLLLAFLCYVSLQMNANLSIYRDIWIYMLYVLSIALSIKLIFFKKNRGLYFFPLLLSLYFLGKFRKYALLSFILAVTIFIAYRNISFFKKPVRFILIAICLLGVYYTFFMEFNVPIVNMALRDALNYRFSSIAINPGGSQMWISLEQPNYLLFLVSYVHSYLGNLLGPLPWHIRGISTLFVFFVETIPMFLILRFILKNKELLTTVQHYILFHAFVWIGLIAVTNDNIGTATRLRAVGWIFILIVFVVVYSKSKSLRAGSSVHKNSRHHDPTPV